MDREQIEKRGVLIIDPQPHMARLVATMLRAIGRRDIRETNTPAQAQSELRRGTVEAVIIDDSIGPPDAVEFVRSLRADATCQNRLVPVIMMAAAPDAARIAAARDAGVTEFLRKPFAASHLQSRLESIAKAPRDFIEARSYAGPDRRRRRVDVGSKDRRGQQDG